MIKLSNHIIFFISKLKSQRIVLIINYLNIRLKK